MTRAPRGVRSSVAKQDLTFFEVTRNADDSLLFVGATSGGATPVNLLYTSDDDGVSWNETDIVPTGDSEVTVIVGLFP